MMEFVADSVSLNIPMPDGVDVKEWNLSPLVPPKVLIVFIAGNFGEELNLAIS